MSILSRPRLALLIFCSLSVSVSAHHTNTITPTKIVSTTEMPDLSDDLDFEGLSIAIDRQLKEFKIRPPRGTIKLGSRTYKKSAMVESLEKMKTILQEFEQCLQSEVISVCKPQALQKIKSSFDIFMPALDASDSAYGLKNPALFTGYYTPLFKGSLEKNATAAYGIYKKPASKYLQAKTRNQIFFEGAFDGQGLGIGFIDDPFELYLLHVEGGGRLEYTLPDGSLKSVYLSYAGFNKKPFRFISKYMKNKGYIDNLSIQAQREFLRDNPDKWEEIYAHCPGFIFFKVTTTPPLGSDNVPLSDNRSIATDSKLYPQKGLISFIKTKRLNPNSSFEPNTDSVEREFSYMPFGRFVLDQDTGGAIKGKARVDIYFGEGPYAKYAAENQKFRGNIYFLMLKTAPHKK